MATDHAISEGVATRVRTIYAPRALEAEKAVQEHIKNLSQFKVREGARRRRDGHLSALCEPSRLASLVVAWGDGCSTTKTTRSTA